MRLPSTATFPLEMAALATDMAGGSLAAPALQARMDQLRKNSHELLRLEWRDGQDAPVMASGPALASAAASRNAAELARKTARPRYSEPYTSGESLIDYHLPMGSQGSLVATYSLKLLLDVPVPWWFAQDNAISLIDGDDTVFEQTPMRSLAHDGQLHAFRHDGFPVTVVRGSGSTRKS